MTFKPMYGMSRPPHGQIKVRELRLSGSGGEATGREQLRREGPVAKKNKNLIYRNLYLDSVAVIH
jgi:hypothetical protein